MGKTRNLSITGLMIALGMVLPMLTGQIPQIGRMLLPMHIPVFICALLCGWQYGLVTGLILPPLRSALFGMPPMYPVAFAMACEMAVYGLVAGFLYFRLKDGKKMKRLYAVYISLLLSMIAGRIVWGIVQAALLGIGGGALSLEAFLGAVLFGSIPGIILQLVLIPALILALDRSKAARQAGA